MRVIVAVGGGGRLLVQVDTREDRKRKQPAIGKADETARENERRHDGVGQPMAAECRVTRRDDVVDDDISGCRQRRVNADAAATCRRRRVEVHRGKNVDSCDSDGNWIGSGCDVCVIVISDGEIRDEDVIAGAQVAGE